MLFNSDLKAVYYWKDYHIFFNYLYLKTFFNRFSFKSLSDEILNLDIILKFVMPTSLNNYIFNNTLLTAFFFFMPEKGHSSF